MNFNLYLFFIFYFNSLSRSRYYEYKSYPLFIHHKVIESEENSDEKAITAMGLLNTIETLLSVMEDNEEIIASLQPTVLQVVGHIFQHSVMGMLFF